MTPLDSRSDPPLGAFLRSNCALLPSNPVPLPSSLAPPPSDLALLPGTLPIEPCPFPLAGPTLVWRWLDANLLLDWRGPRPAPA